METAALRVRLSGFDVKPMTNLTEDQFCRAMNSHSINRADRMEPVFGLPFAYWDREFTEAAMQRVSACNLEWTNKRAEQIANYYPQILQNVERLEKKLEAARAEQEQLKEYKDALARLEELPDTYQSYVETNGYQIVEFRDLPYGAPDDLREAYGALHKAIRDRQAQAQSTIQAHFAGYFSFDEAQFMAPEWKGNAEFNDPRCAVEGVERGKDHNLDGAIDNACRAAIVEASGKRKDTICKRTLEATGLSAEELDVTLLMSADGPPAYNMGDIPLERLLCSYGEETELVWKESSGFFSSSYELTATSRANPEFVTTTLFNADKDRGGLAPTEINHSVDGDLIHSEKLDAQARMLCVVRPNKRYCRGE